MKISKRLEAIASFVSDNSKIIDVGCDHALLDIYLVSLNKNIKAVASDVRVGPLEIAKSNVKVYGYEDKIDVILSDGIEDMPKDCDTVVISGMGGDTIVSILTKDLNKLDNVNTLILSPHGALEKVRKEVCKLGYKIVLEKVIFDLGKHYVIMKFERGKMLLSKEEEFLGPYLSKNIDLDVKGYYLSLKNKDEEILKTLPKELKFKRKELEKEIKMLEEVLSI